MSDVGYLISWLSIKGVWPEVQDIQRVLSKFDLVSVVTGIARIGVRIETWSSTPDLDIDKELVCVLFPKDLAEQIESVRRNSSSGLVFHRLTLLFVLKEAIKNCAFPGKPIESSADLFLMSECFLRANDLLMGYKPTKHDERIQKISALLPFYESIPKESWPEEVTRNRILFETVLPQLAEDRRFVNVKVSFEQSTGMSFKTWAALVFATASKPLSAEKYQGVFGPSFYLTRDFFRTSTFASVEIDSFLSRVSTDLFALRAACSQAVSPTDLSPVQLWPILKLPDGRMVVLDTSFLIDKAGPGVFWIIRERLQEPEASRVFEFWGVILEAYAHWLWSNAYFGKGRYHDTVAFQFGEQAFDAVLVEESTMVAFEYKSGMLPLQAKQSFNGESLARAIEQKFVRSRKGAPKGISQLRNSLLRIASCERLGNHVQYLDNIRTIHPVLVVSEASLTAPFVANHLDLKLDRPSIRGKGKRISIAPLQIATFADLERLLPYTGSVPVVRMLEESNRFKFPAGGLRRRAGNAIIGAPRARSISEDLWREFANELLTHVKPESEL
jgi:hypothetical protein